MSDLARLYNRRSISKKINCVSVKNMKRQTTYWAKIIKITSDKGLK